jgi:hypothetical protein
VKLAGVSAVHEVPFPDEHKGRKRPGQGDDRGHDQQVVDARGKARAHGSGKFWPQGRGDGTDRSGGVALADKRDRLASLAG